MYLLLYFRNLTFVILSNCILCFDGHEIEQQSMMYRTNGSLLPCRTARSSLFRCNWSPLSVGMKQNEAWIFGNEMMRNETWIFGTGSVLPLSLYLVAVLLTFVILSKSTFCYTFELHFVLRQSVISCSM